MGSSDDGGIADEVVRVEAVRYLQGAVGHAVASNLFLLLGGALWVLEYGALTVACVVGAVLLSTNGISIWAWNRLQGYFRTRRTDPEGAESTRTLRATPLSDDSRVEIQAGAVMMSLFVGLLVLARVALEVLHVRVVAALFVAGLGLGNTVALVLSSRGSTD